MLFAKNFDFSFSGLKTAGMLFLKEKGTLDEAQTHDFAASFQHAIVEVLFWKTIKALEKYSLKTLLLAGGVAANSELRSTFSEYCNKHNFKLHYPSEEFCTDNAAMIGAAAQFKYKKKKFDNSRTERLVSKGMNCMILSYILYVLTALYCLFLLFLIVGTFRVNRTISSIKKIILSP